MARIRTIKPEFFTSEDIVGLSPLARLLYIAVWCEADREGRLAWKPRTMKLRYFPADTCDIDALARELVASGLVIPYGDGLAYVPKFSRHQNLNPRESLSVLPDPPKFDASARVNNASLPVSDAQQGREGKGREGKGTDKSSSASPSGEAPDRNDPIPYKAIIDVYNRTMTGLSKVRELNTDRRTAIRKAWQGSERRQSMRYWEAHFAECQDIPFLNGAGPYTNGHENWRPDFEYLVTPKVLTRVFESAMDQMDKEEAANVTN